MLMNYHFSIQILSELGLSKVFCYYAWWIPASNPKQRTHKDFLWEFYLFIEYPGVELHAIHNLNWTDKFYTIWIVISL